MTTRVAVVDDDPVLRALVTDYLTGQGFEVVALDGGSALRAALAEQPVDCVILDLVMPEEDGLSVLRWVRAGSDVPVIMLTSADGTADRVVGLELGADDYVSKPADLRELLARVRSVLRRRTPPPSPSPATAPDGEWFGAWRLDRERRRLVDVEGEVLAVTGTEFEVLCVFADHPHQVLSRAQLLERSGTDPGEVFDRAIDLRIARLRRKVEPDPTAPSVLRTVRGHRGGYTYVPTQATAGGVGGP